MNEESAAQKGPAQSSTGWFSSLSSFLKPGSFQGATQSASQGLSFIKTTSSAKEAVFSAAEGDWEKSQSAAVDAVMEAPGMFNNTFSKILGGAFSGVNVVGQLDKIRLADNAFRQAQGAEQSFEHLSKLKFGDGPMPVSDLVKSGELRKASLDAQIARNQQVMSSLMSIGNTALCTASTPFAVGKELGGFTVEAIKNADWQQFPDHMRQENKINIGSPF